MFKLFLIASVVIFSIAPIKGAVKHIPADAALYQIQLSLKFHKEGQGRLPANWTEFIAGGYLPPEVLNNARKYCDIENRYYFFSPPLALTGANGQVEDVILMAKRSGGEGDTESEQGESVPGRMLILENAAGGIMSRQITEDNLSKLFGHSSLDLSKYTETGGTPRPPSKKESSLLDRLAGESSTERENGSDRRSEKNVERAFAKRNATTYIGVVILMILFGIVLFIRANRKKQTR